MQKKYYWLIGILFIVVVWCFGWWLSRQVWPAVRPVISQPEQAITDQLPTVATSTASTSPATTTTVYVEQGPLRLPAGFNISVFADKLGDPRVLGFAPSGGLLVSLPDRGQIVKVQDRDGDGTAESRVVVADKLNHPHGFFVKCASEEECLLYVAETDQVSLFTYDVTADKATDKRKLFGLPSGGRHTTRTIIETTIDGQDKMLVSIGSSCDVCNETDWRRAAVLVANLDGSDVQLYAKGLRNSVFMVTHLVTGDVWATEMGRDWLGDNLPPDEINILRGGKDYGWPLCYGKNVHDSQFDTRQYIQDPCKDFVPSHIDIPAHSAPLGLAFIPEEGWPESYWYDLLVAYHGSWNRSVPAGYKVVRYRLDAQGNYLGEENFITGWLAERGTASGRPVDILTQPGGVIYISDDKAGVVYRVLYQHNG